LFLFDSNHVSNINAFEKATVRGDRNNNSGGLGAEFPAAVGQRGFGGGDPQRCGDFLFFQKIKDFTAYFGLKFLLKNGF